MSCFCQKKISRTFLVKATFQKKIMSQRLLETDFPSTRPQIRRERPHSGLQMSSKNISSASDWQYEPSFRSGSMSRVQTSFSVVNRTGSLKKALTTSDEEEEAAASETRPLQTKPNNSQSSTSDYHSNDEHNPNLLPVEHRELPQFRLLQLQQRYYILDREVLVLVLLLLFLLFSQS